MIFGGPEEVPAVQTRRRFAWLPVLLDDGGVAWLCFVEQYVLNLYHHGWKWCFRRINKG